MIYPHPEHLIEIAVVEAPVPGDADEAAAHEAGHRGRVETGHQLPHVTLIIAGPLKKFLETSDRHVEQGQELVELNTEAVRQLPAEKFFQRALLRRQVGARGVVHEIKPESGIRFAVADAIEAAQSLQALLKRALPPEAVHRVFLVIRQRAHQLHPVVPVKFRQVFLAGFQ